MAIVLDPGLSNPAAGTSVTSSDGVLTVYADTTYAGMLLYADFSGLSTKPTQVRFYRDGLPVRSGDPAWAPGGQAIAYDHEAELGASAGWTAVPIFADGTIGTTSTTAALAVPEMSDDVDCWIKPTNDPGLSCAFPIHTDQIDEAWAARTQATPVPGRRFGIGTYDLRSPAPMSITLRTVTKAGKTALNKALDTGPVLVQLRSLFGIDDFYAIPGDNSARYFGELISQVRDMPTSFTPCDRPPTANSPLFVPGHSWAQQLAVAPTWTSRLVTWPTWLDALVGTLPPPAALIEESGAPGDEGSP